MSKKLAIGVDLGGSHVAAGAVNTEGEIITFSEKNINKSEKAKKIITNDIYGVIAGCLAQLGDDSKYVKGIGMGIPGRTDSKKGLCVFAPNLKWKNVDICTMLKEKTEIPVFILNDVRAMAVGEKEFGNGQGHDNFLCIAMGTGIGGGIISNGQLLLGADEGAGEIGHITVEPDGPLCGCGNRGCVESLASGPAIVIRAMEVLKKYPESILHKEEFLSPKIIFHAALNGDKMAQDIWKDTGKYLGRAIATIATTVNPELILFSGKVSGAMELFLPSLKEELKERARMVPTENISFMRAKFESNAGIIGSAARAFECLGII